MSRALATLSSSANLFFDVTHATSKGGPRRSGNCLRSVARLISRTRLPTKLRKLVHHWATISGSTDSEKRTGRAYHLRQ